MGLFAPRSSVSSVGLVAGSWYTVRQEDDAALREMYFSASTIAPSGRGHALPGVDH